MKNIVFIINSKDIIAKNIFYNRKALRYAKWCVRLMNNDHLLAKYTING